MSGNGEGAALQEEQSGTNHSLLTISVSAPSSASLALTESLPWPGIPAPSCLGDVLQLMLCLHGYIEQNLLLVFPLSQWGSRDEFSDHKQGGGIVESRCHILLSPVTITAMDLSGKGCEQVIKGHG